MKIVLFLGAVIACSLAAPEPGVAPFASASTVSYHFYSRSNTRGVQINANQITAANLRNVFDASLDTVVLFHGWQDDHTADSNSNVRTALFNNFNVNVVKVNWGPLANQLYASARRAVPGVGRFAAEMLRTVSRLHNNYAYSRVTIIGFSLGAHAAGNMGAALGGQIGQIVGLDPAGPNIDHRDTDYCLDPTDARFVQVIHTNTAFLGMAEAIGHSDYYPNGGATQPNCGIVLTNSCSHNRAWELLSESLSSNRFVGTRCNNYNEFTRNTCTGGRSIMGGLRLDQSARGSYFLNTNRNPPFAMG